MVDDKEFLEKIKPYKKHNLYTAKYKIDENGCVVGIPSNASWIVTVFEGYSNGVGHFTFSKGEIIALILNDEENQFFPVISFLTKEEAKKLAYDLLNLVEGGSYG